MCYNVIVSCYFPDRVFVRSQRTRVDETKQVIGLNPHLVGQEPGELLELLD